MYMGFMSHLFITDEQVAEARQLAFDITSPIFDLIAKNSTISVERTVLRWFGVDVRIRPSGQSDVRSRWKPGFSTGRGLLVPAGLRMGASPLDAVERLTAVPLRPSSSSPKTSGCVRVRAEAR